MKNKRRVTTAIIAGVTALALMVGGTFAWQSINQTALNEASDVINPGGRLHDDFNGTNKDVYVENFADEDIFARIQLSEYFAIIANHGVEGAEKRNEIIGTKHADGTYDYVTYKFDGNVNEDGTFKAAVDAQGNSYWTWTTGGETVFMPTFNKDKDSLEADVNGNYVDDVGGISNRDGTQYENYTNWAEYEGENGTTGVGATMTNMANYDGDVDNLDNGGVITAEETHAVKATLGAQLISMADWIANGSQPGEYWVYDTDGWVYWAQAIKPGEATGLLLDEIQLSQVMDDTWYYAINVVAQFVTAGDLGSEEDGTGFYDTTNGSVPSDNALILLDKIGVNDTTAGGEDDEEVYPVYDIAVTSDTDTDWGFYGQNYAQPGNTYNLQLTKDGEPVEAVEWDMYLLEAYSSSSDWELTGTSLADGVLTIAEDEIDDYNYHVIEVGAADADGNWGYRYFVIGKAGMRGDMFYYDEETGEEVASDALILGKTYRMIYGFQETATNTWVTEYIDPVIVDSDRNIVIGTERVDGYGDIVSDPSVSVSDGILSVPAAGQYFYDFEDPDLASSYMGNSFSVSGISSNHDAVLYNGEDDTELTSLATGSWYSNLKVMRGEEQVSVRSWQISGNNSSGTYGDGGVTVGYFETAESLTLLGFLDGEHTVLQFTLPVTPGVALTDISATHGFAYENGAEGEAMVHPMNSLWCGMICEDWYVVELASFEEFVTTLENATYLENLKALEVVGSDPNALTDLAIDWYNPKVSFRTADYEVPEEHTLYVITEDDRYIAYTFTIEDSEGE